MKPETKLKAIISCDPGAKGSFCVYVPSTGQIAFKNTTDKASEIMEWFETIKNTLDPKIILLEKVHAIQGTSAGSNFKFGFNVGVVNALSEASGIGIDWVTPKTWQKHLKVTKKGPAIKQEVGMLIEKMYPSADIRGPRGGLKDGRTDAMGIMHYARYKYRDILT